MWWVEPRNCRRGRLGHHRMACRPSSAPVEDSDITRGWKLISPLPEDRHGPAPFLHLHVMDDNFPESPPPCHPLSRVSQATQTPASRAKVNHPHTRFAQLKLTELTTKVGFYSQCSQLVRSSAEREVNRGQKSAENAQNAPEKAGTTFAVRTHV